MLCAWRQTFPTQLSTEWTQKQTDLSTAVKKDKERLTRLLQILSQVSIRSHNSQTSNADKKLQGPTGSSTPAKVKVKVTIQEKSQDGTTELDTTSGALFLYLLKSGR